jgi:hypothetical protein
LCRTTANRRHSLVDAAFSSSISHRPSRSRVVCAATSTGQNSPGTPSAMRRRQWPTTQGEAGTVRARPIDWTQARGQHRLTRSRSGKRGGSRRVAGSEPHRPGHSHRHAVPTGAWWRVDPRGARLRRRPFCPRCAGEWAAVRAPP